MKILCLEHLDEVKQRGLAMTYPEKVKIMVGMATCGISAGADKVYQALAGKLEEGNDDIVLDATGCIGYCQREPLVDVVYPGKVRLSYHSMTPETALELLEAIKAGEFYWQNLLCRIDQEEFLIEGVFRPYSNPHPPELPADIPSYHDLPFFKNQVKISLRNCGFINPNRIEEYIARGGYRAFYKAVTLLTPEQVIAEVKASGLRGRGGAGFPTGQKWEFCRQSPGDLKYVICNADEGDPGAFMDRGILEGDPHAVIEGMAIGGYAMGAREGYIYCRAEYPLAISRLKTAITQARSYGILGDKIFNSPFSFNLKIREGAGAFVCGEETALIASIEGRVGEPRSRPPFPAQRGLWKRPTNINNVKTWSHIAPIIARGADWYAGFGTENARGTTVFSLVGKVNNSGLVEIPLGMTLKEMIYDIGGGIQDNRLLKAVQTGGPSGGCIPADLMDTPMEYDSLAKLGSIMGSGGMIVMDQATCMVDLAKYFITFTMEESCGKCTPCREGTQRLLEILTNITEGKGRPADLGDLEELSDYIKEVSLCGLGGTAPNPVLTTLNYFREEYLAHIVDKQCPARVCKRLSPTPCQFACPAGIDIPSYVALIAQGQYEEALELIREDNPLPSVCGYVCTAPCEVQCKRGVIDKPIAIKSLKRFVSDFVRQNGLHGRKKPPARPDRVAIIGSGPAGLSAAYYLAREGYQVTVFEALPVVGGMLRVGIPEFRLPREVLDFDLQNIAELGVEFKTNTRLGRDIFLDSLQEQGYQAFFLSTGTHHIARLDIDGEDLPGVMSGLDFLRQVRTSNPPLLGKRLVIIGGGNVAVDCARTAVRLGSSVTILYRRSETEMPAYADEVAQAKEEGVNFQFLTQPIKILGEDHVNGIVCQGIELGKADASGRRRPIPLHGSETALWVDEVITAIGQIAPQTKISLGDEPLRLTERRNIWSNPVNLATNLPGVFAGGDIVTGPATIVEAVWAGKQAARSICRYLQEEPLEEKFRIPIPRQRIETVEIPDEERAALSRPEMAKSKAVDRIKDFSLVELGFTEEQCRQEALRCLRCDLGD